MSLQQLCDDSESLKVGYQIWRPHTTNRPDATIEVERMTWKNQRVTNDEVFIELKISQDLRHQNIHQVLQYQTVATKTTHSRSENP